MSDMVTRCPACSTSFRITPGQLQKARGAVRCGSCLHIFNAEQYLIAGAKTKPATKPAPKPASKPAPAPRQVPLEIDSETDRPRQGATPAAKAQTPKTAPTARAPQAAKPAAAAGKTEPSRAATAASPAIPAATKKASGLRFDQSQIDRESASDDDDILISDNMDKKADDDDDSLLYIESKTSGRSLFDRNLDTEDKPEFTDDSDESWADHLLEDDTPPVQPATKAPPPSALSIVDTAELEEPVDTETESTTSIPEPRFHISGSRDDDSSGYRESIKAYDRERSAFLLNIDPEPVEMTVADQHEWRRKLLWGGLSAVAVVVLVVQIAWLQFDRLSRIDPYRDYYQSACKVLGCTLPQRIDTSLIRSSNLVVREHPEQPGALLIDAIIKNHARFDQPFPALRLSFSDIDNQPVASRLFAPEEYLRGELAGTRIMPANQPVRLSLEIADPGAHAVNYQLLIQ